ncbi:MAG: CoA-binding protein [Sporomusaceae bacterium]|nr:CoA-binding protein [Sporomusaceae bacterium]
MDQAEKMLQVKTWALVGATDNQSKFGYKIFKFMIDRGFTVYPVNPGVTEVYGHKCYGTLEELPVKPEAVDFVVPARVGEQVVRDCAKLGIQNVWLQPGADAPSVVKLAEELGLTVVTDCVMVRFGGPH